GATPAAPAPVLPAPPCRAPRYGAALHEGAGTRYQIHACLGEFHATVIVLTGHLMGKKSTGDFPYGYEEENKIPFSALPENIKQLDDSLQWEEMSKYLLRLLEGNENKSAHFSKGGLPWYTRNTWETDDNSSWKDVSKTKSLVQVQIWYKYRFGTSTDSPLFFWKIL
uniref:Gastrin-releasing peptide n=1 Tax=Anas zonorhyncha TaxID=75864 RepID=A0A8B9UNL4_9AVES